MGVLARRYEGHGFYTRPRNPQDMGSSEIWIQMQTPSRSFSTFCEMGRTVSASQAGEAWRVGDAWSVLIPFLSLPLARTVFLRLASLLVLLFSLWNQITCGGDAEAAECKTCGYNYKELPVRTATNPGPL